MLNGGGGGGGVVCGLGETHFVRSSALLEGLPDYLFVCVCCCFLNGMLFNCFSKLHLLIQVFP